MPAEMHARMPRCPVSTCRLLTLLAMLACSSAAQEWKPSDYKALKRKVAQLLTVRREREVRREICAAALGAAQ